MILAADCKSVGKCQVATDEFDSYISHLHASMPRWRVGTVCIRYRNGVDLEPLDTDESLYNNSN